jgi:putative Mg2+ transporter-C (MgtC) family protein
MGLFETQNNIWETALRLGIAILLAALLGWERESKQRPAGLRTHMLVALGAAGLTVVAMELLARLERDNLDPNLYDPLRIVEAVVGGIGFLGAGAIIQSRGKVKGVTTAASLWIVAAVGVASGCGNYATAGLLAVFGLFTLLLVRFAERKIPHTSGGDSVDDDSS